MQGRNAGSFAELALLGAGVGADNFGSEGVGGGGGKAAGAVDCKGSGAGQAVQTGEGRRVVDVETSASDLVRTHGGHEAGLCVQLVVKERDDGDALQSVVGTECAGQLVHPARAVSEGEWCGDCFGVHTLERRAK